MKKVFLLFAAVAMSASVMAQESKIYWSLGDYGTSLNIKEIPVGVCVKGANIRQVEAVFELPNIGSLTKDEVLEKGIVVNDEGDIDFTLDPTRCAKNCAAQVMLTAPNRVYVNVQQTKGKAFAGDDGSLGYFTVDASYLLEENGGPGAGDYIIKLVGNDGDGPFIQFDKDSGNGVEYYDPETNTAMRDCVKFTVAPDGSVSSVGHIIAEDPAVAQKGIYNIQGMKIRQTVPGRLYIVNGKKVIANEVISAE